MTSNLILIGVVLSMMFIANLLILNKRMLEYKLFRDPESLERYSIAKVNTLFFFVLLFIGYPMMVVYSSLLYL